MAPQSHIMRMVMIGAGHVGQTLGRCWTQQQVAHVIGVCNRSLTSSQQACKLIGAGQAYTQLNELPDADVYAIFTPDDAIAATAAALAAAIPLTGKTVIHASGLHSSRALEAAKQAGAMVASIHPAKAFYDPIIAAQTFAGTCCGIEGDATAITASAPLFTAIGAKLLPLDAQYKTAYHGACVIAANFTVTLKDLAIRAFTQAGLGPEHAAQMADQLMAQALTSMQHQTPQQALTGPAKRGDKATIAAHQQAFAHTDIATIYDALHLATAQLVARQAD